MRVLTNMFVCSILFLVLWKCANEPKNILTDKIDIKLEVRDAYGQPIRTGFYVKVTYPKPGSSSEFITSRWDDSKGESMINPITIIANRANTPLSDGNPIANAKISEEILLSQAVDFELFRIDGTPMCSRPLKRFTLDNAVYAINAVDREVKVHMVICER